MFDVTARFAEVLEIMPRDGPREITEVDSTETSVSVLSHGVSFLGTVKNKKKQRCLLISVEQRTRRFVVFVEEDLLFFSC